MKKLHASIEQLIQNLKDEKAEIEQRIKALEIGPKCLEEELLLEYIRTRSTVKAAQYAKEKGLKSPSGTVFSPGDMSNIIIGGGKNIKPALLRIAQEIFERNSRAVQRIYG